MEATKYEDDWHVQRARWALSNLIHERMEGSGVIAQLSHKGFVKTFVAYGDVLLAAMAELESLRPVGAKGAHSDELRTGSSRIR